MANRWMQQFYFSLVHMPVYLEGNFVVGSSGAVGTLKGSGIKSVVRLAAGQYQINLEDAYNRYMSGSVAFASPVTGSNVAAASLAAGTVYVITAVGTTNWVTAGLDPKVTPAVGVSFKATAASTGTGTAKVAGASGIMATELVGDPNLTINQPNAYLIVQTLNASGAATDPAAGSTLGFTMTMRNSSVKGKGE